MPTAEHGVIPPHAGETLAIGGFDVVYKLDGQDTGGAFAISKSIAIACRCRGSMPST